MPISISDKLRRDMLDAFVSTLNDHRPLRLMLFTGPYHISETLPCSIIARDPETDSATLASNKMATRTVSISAAVVISGKDESILIHKHCQPPMLVCVGDYVEFGLSMECNEVLVDEKAAEIDDEGADDPPLCPQWEFHEELKQGEKCSDCDLIGQPDADYGPPLDEEDPDGT